MFQSWQYYLFVCPSCLPHSLIGTVYADQTVSRAARTTDICTLLPVVSYISQANLQQDILCDGYPNALPAEAVYYALFGHVTLLSF